MAQDFADEEWRRLVRTAKKAIVGVNEENFTVFMLLDDGQHKMTVDLGGRPEQLPVVAEQSVALALEVGPVLENYQHGNLFRFSEYSRR